MLYGILVVHRSGVLIAAAGIKEEIEKKSRLSNLISATLFMAESIGEDTVKSVTTNEKRITITPCPQNPKALVTVVTGKEDANASIIANYAAEVVQEAIGAQAIPDVIPQELTDQIKTALTRRVVQCKLPSIDTLQHLTREIASQLANGKSQQFKKQVREIRRKKKEKETTAYQKKMREFAKNMEIPSDAKRAMRKAVKLFYQCDFLPAYYMFTQLTETELTMWAKLLAVATGLTLYNYLTKEPAPPLEEIEGYLHAVEEKEAKVPLLRELLSKEMKFLKHPFRGIWEIKKFLETYAEVLVRFFEETSEFKQSLLAILFSVSAHKSKKITEPLASFFHGKSSFFHRLYKARKEGKESLLTFKEMYNLPRWGEVYDPMLRLRKQYEKQKARCKKWDDTDSGKKQRFLKGILYVRLSYFLTTVVDTVKGIRNLPKEAIDFLMEVHESIGNELSRLAEDPGLIRLKDYCGVLHYSTQLQELLLEVLPPSKSTQIQKISKRLQADFKAGYLNLLEAISPEAEEVSKIKSILILSNVAKATERSSSGIFSFLMKSLSDFLQNQKRDLQECSLHLQWWFIKDLTILLTRCVTSLPGKQEELIHKIHDIYSELVNCTLAHGFVAWSVFSNYFACAREVVSVTAKREELSDILHRGEMLRRILFEAGNENWRRKQLAKEYIHLLLEFERMHGPSFPALRTKAKHSLTSLLETMGSDFLPPQLEEKMRNSKLVARPNG